MDIIALRDRECDQPVLVMGGGPSLLDINKDDYRNAVKIVCNDYYRSAFYKDFKPDYWCAACSINTLMGLPKFGGEKILDHAITNGLTLFIGIPRPNERDAVQKYVEGFSYEDFACFWDWGNMEIQKLLNIRYQMGGALYSHGTSVIVHQIALAFWMGCNPISVTGMDLSYALAIERTGQTHAGFSEKCLEDDDRLQVESTLRLIHHDLAYFGQIAKRAGIQFYNLSWRENKVNFDGFLNE